jgi:hypothetical protein
VASIDFTDDAENGFWPASFGLLHDAACAFERAGLEPRYRRLRYVVAPRYFGLRLAFLKALDGLLALMRGQGGRSTKPHTASLSAVAAVTGTGKDQLALAVMASAGVAIDEQIPAAVEPYVAQGHGFERLGFAADHRL